MDIAAARGAEGLIDISLAIGDDLPIWPGDPRPELHPVATLARDGVQVSRLVLGTHTGTHLDAPRHFIPDGRSVDQLDLDAVVGPCRVVDLGDRAGHVRRQDVERFAVEPGTRLLLKTANSRRPPAAGWSADFVALEPSAADYLCERGVRLVGIDGPSVDAWEAAHFPCHRRLLAADVVIVEHLVLRHVQPGSYLLIAVPLKLRGADGCPVRAILAPIGALTRPPA
jgi:arylformamidase